MGTPPLSDDDCDEVLAALERNGGNVSAAALAMGLPRTTYQSRLRSARARMVVASSKPTFTAPILPDGDVPIEEIIERLCRGYGKRAEAEDARRLIPVTVHRDGPIGIVHMGDPHVDDDGCNWPLLRKHLDVIRKTDGLMGATVGDLQNGWVGRLARLYGNQETSARTAWRLVEWFVRSIPWLYIVKGNHDCHDDQTECLTRRGWLRYDQISDDDQVLSLNIETGACEWSPVLRRIVRPYDGEMISINTRSVNAFMTPNHRVLCQDRDRWRNWSGWKFITADSLPSRVALPVSGVSNNNGVALSDDQIAFAGWVLTDGNIHWDGNCPKITLYQSKDGAEIERLLSALGLDHRHRTRTRQVTSVAGRTLLKAPLPQHEWVLTAAASRKVLEWLPSKGTLPDWAFDLSNRQFGVLLDAIIAGDGCWDGVAPESKTVAVVHGTAAFLSSLQSVAVQHGWYTRISVARGKDYRLNLCRREMIQFETKPAVMRERYRGNVWCLTVPHGNFMVRRGGAAHFSGNCWAGNGDPLDWMARSVPGPVEPWGCRLDLRFPNGRGVRVNARHDFAGHSMWNTVHGPLKAATMGWRDHILTCGHKHTSGYAVLKDPATGLVSHAIRVGGYKQIDDYAKELGLPNQNIFPSAVTVIDPQFADDDPRLVTTLFDVEEGAEYLTWRRGKWGKGKRAA